MAEVNLLPCPFCGGEPFMVDEEIDDRVHYIVKCGTCHCTSGVMQMSRPAAAEAWNRRAERTCRTVSKCCVAHIHVDKDEVVRKVLDELLPKLQGEGGGVDG